MNDSFEIELKDPESTIRFGKVLGSCAGPGQVIALIGELGAGKTTLVKAIARGAGISNDDMVSSPSYTLINEYYGRIPIYHFDLYRLEGAGDIEELGYVEYLEGEGLSLIEWADMAPQMLPPEYLEVKIEITGDESRKISLTAKGDIYKRIVSRLKSRNNAP